MRVNILQLIVWGEKWHVLLVDLADLLQKVASLINRQETVLVDIGIIENLLARAEPLFRLHVTLDLADQIPLLLIGRRLLEPVHLQGLVLPVLNGLPARVYQRLLVIELVEAGHAPDGVQPELLGPAGGHLVPDAPDRNDAGDETDVSICAGRYGRKLVTVGV